MSSILAQHFVPRETYNSPSTTTKDQSPVLSLSSNDNRVFLPLMSQFDPPMSPPLGGGDEKKLESQTNDNKNVSLNFRLCAGEIEYELLQGATHIQQHKVEHLTPPPNTTAPSLNEEPKPVSFLPASTRLRNMINKGDKLIVCPGVYDGFSARIAMSLPFPALYMVSKYSGFSSIQSTK